MKNKEKTPFISITQGLSGWFAVLYCWNTEGFWEPEQSGLGRYADKEKAKLEARNWSQSEGVRCTC